MDKIVFPKHKASLHINHNQHKAYYMKIEDYIAEKEKDDQIEFKEIFDKCIEKDEIWEMQVYPLTPVGFYTVYSDTFEGLFT